MGKVPKVVIDCNVFISAFGWDGKPLQIVKLLEDGEIGNCASEDMLRELQTSLSYPKLDFSEGLQSGVMEFVIAYSTIYEPRERLSAAPDPDDDKLIECAVAAGAKFIITGDKGLLKLEHFRAIKILSPDDFLKGFSDD